jgi:hypothetical protein
MLAHLRPRCRADRKLSLGKLGAEDQHAIAAHRRACPDCLAFLQTYKTTIELTRSLLRLGRALHPLELRR